MYMYQVFRYIYPGSKLSAGVITCPGERAALERTADFHYTPPAIGRRSDAGCSSLAHLDGRGKGVATTSIILGIAAMHLWLL